MTSVNYVNSSEVCPGCWSRVKNVDPKTGKESPADPSHFKQHWVYCPRYEGVDKEYPCRCGRTHIGELGLRKYLEHECFHTASPLLIDNIVPTLAMCPSCGASFNIEYEKIEEEDNVSRITS